MASLYIAKSCGASVTRLPCGRKDNRSPQIRGQVAGTLWKEQNGFISLNAFCRAYLSFFVSKGTKMLQLDILFSVSFCYKLQCFTSF